jgi:hypothetical protein
MLLNGYFLKNFEKPCEGVSPNKRGGWHPWDNKQGMNAHRTLEKRIAIPDPADHAILAFE